MSSKPCASTRRAGSRKNRAESGFTLLELLVALAVFAVISAVAYGGLDSLLRIQAASEAGAARLAALQLAFQHLERDLGQAVARPVRDEFGMSRPAFEGDMTRLEFTRAGWDNPLDQPRGTLQRVTYYRQGDALYRGYWPVLDRAPQTALAGAPLLENVGSLAFRYLDGGPNPQSQWPPYGAATTGLRAVEVVLEIPEWGRIRRLFVLPGADRQGQ